MTKARTDHKSTLLPYVLTYRTLNFYVVLLLELSLL